MAYGKYLKSIFKQLEKDEDIVAFSAETYKLPPRIKTASPSVNWAMDGGIVPGRVYVYEGPKSGGKSFFTLSCVTSLLRNESEGVVFWFDTEYSFSDHFANILMTPEERERLVVIQTSDPVKIFDYFHDTLGEMMSSKEDPLKVLACVVDSLQTIVAPQEAEAEKTSDMQYAPLPRYLKKAFNRVTPLSRKHGVTWFYISQVRQNMDQGEVRSGEKWSVSGGEAFKHLTDCDMQFSVVGGKDSKIVDSDLTNMNDSALRLGHTIRVTNKKHRVGTPYRIAEFKLNYARGIVDSHEEIVALANNLKLLKKDGNTYIFNGQKIAVGMPATIKAVAKSPVLQEALLLAIDSWQAPKGGSTDVSEEQSSENSSNV